MTIAEASADFRIGRVVSRTFQVLTRNAVPFLITTAVLLSPVLLVTLYTGTNSGITAFRTHGVVVGIVALVVPFACIYLLQASLVQATITVLNGNKPSIGNSLATGWRVVLPVTAILILKYLGMMVGLVLLVIPGIMVALAWTVAIPVFVIEHTGILQSFGRSRALTKGYRWHIFGLVMMYFVAAVPLIFLTALLTRVNILTPAGQAAPGTYYLIASWVEQILLSAVTAVGTTVIYFELRSAKEGIAPEQLVAAFD